MVHVALLFLAFVFLIFTLFGCSRDSNNPITIHCDNLQNDTRPPSDEAIIYVANAITPNGDGLNDQFSPFLIDVQSATIKIYSENSNLLLETTDFSVNWPVSNQSEDYVAYYYRIEGITDAGNKIGVCGKIHSLICIPSSINANQLSFSDQLTPLGFTGPTSEVLDNCN